MKIEFKRVARHGRFLKSVIYDFHVIDGGHHVATWTRNSGRTGYFLTDILGTAIRLASDTARCRSQSDFLALYEAVKAAGNIPSEATIAERIKSQKESVARYQEQREAEERLERVQNAGPDLLAALKLAAPYACRALCPQTWPIGESQPPHHKDCQIIRDAIQKASGE